MQSERQGQHWMLLAVILFTSFVLQVAPETLPHFVAAVAGSAAADWFRR